MNQPDRETYTLFADSLKRYVSVYGITNSQCILMACMHTHIHHACTCTHVDAVNAHTNAAHEVHPHVYDADPQVHEADPHVYEADPHVHA